MSNTSEGSQCQSGQTWENWAKTIEVKPQCLFKPKSENDLVSIVQQAAAAGTGVRVHDSGHSWSPGWVTKDYLVDCTQMTHHSTEIRSCPNGEQLLLLHCEPGVTQGQVASEAERMNWTLPTLGVVPSITIGGFIANGCHATGWNQPTVADLTYGMRIVTADGTVHDYNEQDTPDMMPFIRCNLGAFGIISQLTFKCVPMFFLAVVDETQDMADLVARDDPTVLAKTVTQHEYVELFWFPFNKKIWYKHYDRHPGPSTLKPIDRIWNRIFGFLSTVGGKLVLDWLAKNPSYTPEVMEALFAFAPTHNHYVAKAFEAFLYQDETFKVLDFSFAIPIPDKGQGNFDFTAANNAWYALVDAVNQQASQGNYPVNVTLHARFIRNSQALLSPAYQDASSNTHHCYIEFLSFQPDNDLSKERLQIYTDFTKLAGPLWLNQGGRVHWAKLFQDIPDVFEKMFQAYGGSTPTGNMQRFLSKQKQLDPNGMFMNQLLKDITTGKKSP